MAAFNANNIPTTVFDLDQTRASAQHQAAMVKRLIDLLLTALETSAAALQSAYANHSIDDMRMQAHKLNGGLCYVSAPQLHYLTRALEQACIDQSDTDIDLIYPHFCDAVKVLQAQLTDLALED